MNGSAACVPDVRGTVTCVTDSALGLAHNTRTGSIPVMEAVCHKDNAIPILQSGNHAVRWREVPAWTRLAQSFREGV